MTDSPTLKRLREQHPEWCPTCGKIERGQIHSCYQSPVMAFIKETITALDVKALDDEARIEKLNTAANERARQINQLKDKLRNPEKRFADLQSQLTAEREAHEVTRKALEDADKALILCRSSWNRPYDDIKHIQASTDAALARAAARRSEKERG